MKAFLEVDNSEQKAAVIQTHGYGFVRRGSKLLGVVMLVPVADDGRVIEYEVREMPPSQHSLAIHEKRLDYDNKQ